MLSRAAILSAGQGRLLAASTRVIQVHTSAEHKKEVATSSERDLVNFPRPVRLAEPGKVRMGFIPEEWFQFFYNKTGVTGPYTFGVGLITYLCSKEIFVMEHEYYSGISVFIMAYLIVTKLGPKVAATADKNIEEYENSWKQGRQEQMSTLEKTITEEQHQQASADGQLMLMEAKRENIAMQLEAAYRERLMQAYSEVKKRLDYQVEKRDVDRRISQKHMVNWVVNKVMSSITPDQEKEALNKCIADLGALAAVKR